jgi:hypothetical protein
MMSSVTGIRGNYQRTREAIQNSGEKGNDDAQYGNTIAARSNDRQA